jgi:hypothetical protein
MSPNPFYKQYVASDRFIDRPLIFQENLGYKKGKKIHDPSSSL